MDEVNSHIMVGCSKGVLGCKFVCSDGQISKTAMFHVFVI